MRAFYKLSLVQAKLFTREPIALFFTLAFPVLLLILYGVIFGNEIDPAYSNQFGYIDSEVPGLAAIIIGTVGFVSIPIATATAREQKILRRLKMTPMKPITYLAADVIVNFLTALAGLILLVIVALLSFDLRFGGNWYMVLAGFTLSMLAFSAVGYLIASVANTSRMAQVLGQLLFFPMMFLSGATLPLDIMPEGVRQVANLMPLTHVVNLLQSLWFGYGWDGTAVTILVVMLIVGATASSYVFRWE